MRKNIKKLFLSLQLINFFRLLSTIYSYLLVAFGVGKSPRSLKQSLILCLAVITIGLSICWPLVTELKIPVPNDGHSLTSFAIALNRVACGNLSHVANPIEGKTVQQVLIGNAEILTQRALSLPKVIAGSTEAYCRNSSPFLNNENSLMWMMEAFLRLFPNITIQGLALALNWVRVISLISFVFLLLRIGISPIATLATFILGLIIVAQVNTTHYFSLYPFLMPFTLLLVALFGLTLSFGAHRRVGITLIILTLIGVFAAFFKNLRTSYYPVILACLVLYVVFAVIDLKRVPDNLSRIRKAILPGLAVLSFFLGMAAFNTVFVTPLERNIKTGYNLTYHTVAHPLVLGLALPESNLSRREGIKWDDAQGEVLARRIDPTVNYLTPNYEKVMFAYYRQLWLKHPYEMLGIYKEKLMIAGHHSQQYKKVIFSTESLRDRFVRILAMPMSLLPNGAAYLIVFVGLAALGLLGLRFMNVGAAFALTALASSGILLLIESAIIIPFFTMTYHSYLLYWILCIGLLAYQFIINLFPWLLHRFVQLANQKQI